MWHHFPVLWLCWLVFPPIYHILPIKIVLFSIFNFPPFARHAISSLSFSCPNHAQHSMRRNGSKGQDHGMLKPLAPLIATIGDARMVWLKVKEKSRPAPELRPGPGHDDRVPSSVRLFFCSFAGVCVCSSPFLICGSLCRSERDRTTRRYKDMPRNGRCKGTSPAIAILPT